MANNSKKYASLTSLQNLVKNIKNIFATKTDVDTKLNTELAKKADKSHSHDNTYYTKALTDAMLVEKSDVTHNHNGKYDVYGTASTAVSSHNTSTSSHNDIRLSISELTTKLNNFLDVDDTTTDQLSELIALIQANATDIESITSGKVNVSDIVNNLTTNVTDKPLSAAQGVAIMELIEELQIGLEDKAPQQHSSSLTTYGIGTSTKYGHVKISDAVDSDSVARSGIAASPSSVKAAYDLANTAKTTADSKADATHNHSISDVTNLQGELQGKVSISRTINSKSLISDVTLSASDVGAAPSSHNHDDRYYTETEIDTKLANKSDTTHNHDGKYDAKGSASAVQTNLNTVSDTLDDHTTNTDIHVSTNEKGYWNSAHAHSISPHARADATKVADSTTNGNILINDVETTVYSHPTSTVVGGTYKSVLVDNNGHVIQGFNPTTLAGYGITDAEAKGSVSTHNTSNSAHNDIRDLITGLTNRLNAVADSDDTTLDQLSEIVNYIKSNKTLIDSITTDKVNVSDIVNNLTTNVSNKPLSAAQGVAISEMIEELLSELDSHSGNSNVHVTSTEKREWNVAKNHAESAHAPVDAEPNQNAFSNIKVGSTTIEADTTTDTLELVGNNVTITPDETNDKITIAVASGTTVVKGVVQLTDSTSSTSKTTAATPNSVKSAYDLANTAKTNAATAQSKADSAYSLAEGKVDSLSDLGITTTATELNHLDGVTSNVQSQLDGKATSSHKHTDLEEDIADLDERMLKKVSKSGDTMTGNLKIQKDDGLSPVFSMDAAANSSGQRASLSISKNANSSVDNGTEIEDETFDGSTTSLVINRSAKYLADRVRIQERDANYSITEYALYGEHNKPTPYDIGALSSFGGKVTGNITPATAMTYTIGSSTLPFASVYAKNHEVFGNASKKYGSLAVPTVGTTTTNGVCSLALGNGTASGTADNAYGRIVMYGTGNGYTRIIPSYNGGAALEVLLPSNAGTLVTDKDLETLASVASVSTAEYTALENAGTLNANTLYMLTDAEEEEYYTKSEIDNMEFITIEEIDAICEGSIQAANEVMF